MHISIYVFFSAYIYIYIHMYVKRGIGFFGDVVGTKLLVAVDL